MSKVRVTITEPPPPPVPEATVTLEMPLSDARQLRTLLGSGTEPDNTGLRRIWEALAEAGVDYDDAFGRRIDAAHSVT